MHICLQHQRLGRDAVPTSITAIVVIYNKSIENSLTCKNLLKMDLDIDLLVVDNSVIPTNNKEYCVCKGIRYLSMNGNLGLSKAYNRAIDESPDSDVYVFFDDDTNITEDYFNELKLATADYPNVDIFAPVIIGQDGVFYSPNASRFMKNRLMSNISDEIEQDSFNAIASCLAVRSRVFEDYRFNETLFVDQVDQNFFDDQRSRNVTFMKLDICILQNFYQRGNNLTPKAGWARLNLRIIDLMRYARLKERLRYVFLGWAKCCGLGLQIAKKTHSATVFFKAAGLATRLLIFPS